MAYNMTTLSGHNFYDISSMLQKAIRRGDIDRAGYAANELYYKFDRYLWKRLLVISAEDCYGIMTKEIVALKMADDIVNKGKKREDTDGIFVSKAVTLLCMARKNRDACYVACNFMYLERTLEVEEVPYVNIDECELVDDYIPDWVFDVHTLKGKYKGRTGIDMIRDEQAGLNPLQLSLFDEGSWEPRIMEKKRRGNYYKNDYEWRQALEFIAGKEADPTHNGEDWPDHEENWTQVASPKTTKIRYDKAK